MYCLILVFTISIKNYGLFFLKVYVKLSEVCTFGRSPFLKKKGAGFPLQSFCEEQKGFTLQSLTQNNSQTKSFLLQSAALITWFFIALNLLRFN